MSVLNKLSYEDLCGSGGIAPSIFTSEPDGELSASHPRRFTHSVSASDRSLSAELVPTFADRGYHAVSVTDPYGRILAF
jgi:hypothetical protein